MAAVVADVDHANVPLPLAVSVVDGIEQLNAKPLLFAIEAPGAAISCVMLIDDVDVQPLAPVTVTVYVPGAVIEAAALLPSPPLHA